MNRIHDAASAIEAGFTKAIFASSSEVDFNLFVKPDADLDGTFDAWDDDWHEIIRVNGWLFTIEDAGEATLSDGILRKER